MRNETRKVNEINVNTMTTEEKIAKTKAELNLGYDKNEIANILMLVVFAPLLTILVTTISVIV